MTSPTATEEIERLVERLRARNERFQSGHGNYLYYGGSDSILDCDAANRLEALLAALRAAEAERDALREALQPFVQFAENVAAERPGWDHDNFRVLDSFDEKVALYLAPFRRARAALQSTSAKEGES